MVSAAVDRRAPSELINEIAARGGIATATASGRTGITVVTAVFVVLGPWVSRRWQRAGAGLVGALVLLRLVVSYQPPLDIVIAVPLGITCGLAVLVALGRPAQRPILSALVATLRRTGLAVVAVDGPPLDTPPSSQYTARLEDGQRLFVRVLGSEEQTTTAVARAYRFVRLRDVGDERPFWSLRRNVEHEALVALYAHDVGVRTPAVRAVAPVEPSSMLLASDAIEGTPLDRADGAAISDEAVRDVWRQVACLRSRGIAHRNLGGSSVVIDEHAQAWIVGFGTAQLAGDDAVLDGDVAQLLVSLALVVGVERTVTAAVAGLGVAPVAAALPRLQPNALSRATHAALKHHPGLLASLQHELMVRCDVASVQYVELERLTRRTLLTVVVLVAATYFLLPQLSDLPGIWTQVRAARWSWSPLVALMSVITYLGAAVALLGSVTTRLRFGPTLTAQVAASFTGTLAPAGLGGLALNVRFLQRQGIDRPVAVSSVGLDAVAGVVAHVSLIGVFVVWAGQDAFGSFRLPDVGWFLLAAGAAAVVLALALCIAPTRRFLLHRLWPTVRRAYDGLAAVVRRPTKVAELLGGSVVLTVGYLLSLYFAVEAFGGGLPLATVGAVYLVGSAVASAAPTPGGLGAMEAALIAGLVAAGLDNAVAVPAVFLYRLATFWLPILPGWLCFTWLQRHDHL